MKPKRFCYNCKYFKILNTEIYKLRGLCLHPKKQIKYVSCDATVPDTKFFKECCELWEARS